VYEVLWVLVMAEFCMNVCLKSKVSLKIQTILRGVQGSMLFERQRDYAIPAVAL